jgi:hypothetical protein
MSNPTPVAPGASLLGITTAPTTQYNDVSTNPSVNCADVIADADVRVGDLARQISNISTSELQLTKTASTIGGLRNANPFEDCTKYPELDPASDKFSARKWAKTLIYLNNNHVDANGNLEELRAGVSFRNLDVHGFGKETDYQKNVANIWLGLAEYAKGLFGVERKRKIQILKDFEGVVRNGEMLVVLGRPGSGCSTLLKTISGDTHGLFVDENSQINYQGIPKEVMHKNFRGEVVYQAETDGMSEPLIVRGELKEWKLTDRFKSPFSTFNSWRHLRFCGRGACTSPPAIQRFEEGICYTYARRYYGYVWIIPYNQHHGR